jgi:hypothetical protein
MPPRTYPAVSNPDGALCIFTQASTAKTWIHFSEPDPNFEAPADDPEAEGPWIRRWFAAPGESGPHKNQVRVLKKRLVAAGIMKSEESWSNYAWQRDGPPLAPPETLAASRASEADGRQPGGLCGAAALLEASNRVHTMDADAVLVQALLPAEQGSDCKRKRAEEDEDALGTTSADAASLQALLDAIEEPGLRRLCAYAELSGLDDLMTSDSLQAHTELLLTSAQSSMSGCDGPVEGITAPSVVVQGLVLICQEMVATTSATREAVSARTKLTSFAWLLADVMGQVTSWDAEVALKVGKRMERSLFPVHASLAEHKIALVEALRAGDIGEASLAQTAMREVLSAPTHSAIVELSLPADQAQVASASLTLLAARDSEVPLPVDVDAVLDAIPRLTQRQLWQVVERAQDELKARTGDDDERKPYRPGRRN